jgi:hypothetical protein
MERLRENFFITLFNYQNLSNVYFLPKKKEIFTTDTEKNIQLLRYSGKKCRPIYKNIYIHPKSPFVDIYIYKCSRGHHCLPMET